MPTSVSRWRKISLSALRHVRGDIRAVLPIAASVSDDIDLLHVCSQAVRAGSTRASSVGNASRNAPSQIAGSFGMRPCRKNVRNGPS